MCERLAASLGTELLVLRRGAGGLLARWRQRWENNKQRYAKLECVRVIMPWSSAAARFCTSELKTAIACRALAKRFVGRPILSVTGIRRAESAARSKAPVCTPQQRLVRKRAGTSGWTGIRSFTGLMPKSLRFCGNETSPCMSPIPFMAVHGFPARFLCFPRAADFAAASRCESNQNVYRQLVALEAESSFSFQPGRWLGDVAPHLLSTDLARQLARAKDVARQREALESQIPDDLLLSKGVPGRLPTRSEAELLASIRREISHCSGSISLISARRRSSRATASCFLRRNVMRLPFALRLNSTCEGTGSQPTWNQLLCGANSAHREHKKSPDCPEKWAVCNRFPFRVSIGIRFL